MNPCLPMADCLFVKKLLVDIVNQGYKDGTKKEQPRITAGEFKCPEIEFEVGKHGRDDGAGNKNK